MRAMLKFEDRNNNPVYLDANNIIGLEVAYLGNHGTDYTGTIIYTSSFRFIVTQNIEEVLRRIENAD